MKLHTILLLISVLFLAILLRTIQFTAIPPGLYVDEAGAGYESLSLLRTGADRWGTHLPVYFISWGSGQSVLYSYLSIPVIAILGLSRFSIRLVALFFGILTIPLLYVTVRRTLGTRAALLSAFLLAIMPWHVMVSRWALDANLLPFFLLLGTYTVQRALDPEQSPLWRIIALVPWGLALYAYAMAYIVVPLMLVLLLAVYYRTILLHWKDWLAGFLFIGVLAAPIALFVAKNFIVHDNLAFEMYLPLGIPLLPVSRLAEVSSPLPERMLKNFFFLVSGFQDGEIRNSIIGIAPTFLVLFPLTFAGAAYLIQSRRANVFLLWLAACLALFFPADLAINRINAIFIPMLVIAMFGFLELQRRIAARRVLAMGVGALIAVQGILFLWDYFLVYPVSADTQLAFFNGFDRAVTRSIAITQPSDPILVTDRIALPYILTAFFANYPPERFQHEIRYVMQDGSVQVKSFGRFYFGQDNLPVLHGSFTYVLAKVDPVPCANPQPALETRLWQVGKCK